MRTWILGSTIGTAIVARDRLDQLLQTALVAHLLALIDGGHVYIVGLGLRGPVGVLQVLLAGQRGRLEVFGCRKDQGQRRSRSGGRVLDAINQSINQHNSWTTRSPDG